MLKTGWGWRRIKGMALTFLIFAVLTPVRAQTESHILLPSGQSDTTVQPGASFPGFTGPFLDIYRKNDQLVYVTYNSMSSPAVQLKPTVIYGHVLIIENNYADYNENPDDGKRKAVERGLNELRLNILPDTAISILIIKPNPASDFVIVE